MAHNENYTSGKYSSQKYSSTFAAAWTGHPQVRHREISGCRGVPRGAPAYLGGMPEYHGASHRSRVSFRSVGGDVRRVRPGPAAALDEPARARPVARWCPRCGDEAGDLDQAGDQAGERAGDGAHPACRVALALE